MMDGFDTTRHTPDPRDPRAPELLRRSESPANRGWNVLGLPYDGGIPSRPGARFGPTALRAALAGFGIFDGEMALDPVTDLGNLSLPTMNGAEAHRRIEQAARRLFEASTPAFFIGGDHGCTGSVLRGLAAARPGIRLALVSIDAHLDVREYEGEAALSSGTPFRRALELDVCSGDRTAILGLRPFANSAHYLEWARRQGMLIRTVEEVAREGAGAVVRAALERVADSADAIYLSIDLDAADVAFAPGVSAPGTGGLSSREMLDLVAAVATDPRLIGADLMELSPPFDQDDQTAKLGARLLLEVLRNAVRER
jgi:formimidoylglutamase